ncbi:Vacuolar sorting-associated protein 18 [Gossypium australe]|uniref:Vacuolar sorting-associated protein 18 n=1 Tax=Gossypium australe TaxID=47621 RepID=A0A5B6URT0_9ROSI|nr:Vacuolar sorting-associated protein 18 [Gossypium australe]
MESNAGSSTVVVLTEKLEGCFVFYVSLLFLGAYRISAILNHVWAQFQSSSSYLNRLFTSELDQLLQAYNTYKHPMVPSRTDNPEMGKKHLKVRTKAKRLKTEMGKVREDQLCLIEEQSKLMTRFREIERQCNELKQEAQMMAKQSALTRLKLELMLGILKAREGGDLVQAANLTRFLR